MTSPLKIIPLLLVLLLIVGCAENRDTNSSDGTANGTHRPSSLIVGITSDVSSFNPLYGAGEHDSEFRHLTNPGLIDMDAECNIVPGIAKSWEHSSDRRELTYYLRDDVRWEDGQPVTAHDVKFTFECINDTANGNEISFLAMNVEKVVVNDSFTVTFHLARAYLNDLYDTGGELLPKHLLADVPADSLRDHDYTKRPLAYGAYRVASRTENQYLELVANESYYGERPQIDQIALRIIPDYSALNTMLQTGEVDMVIGLPPEYAAQLAASSEEINLHPISGRLYYFIGYNEALESLQTSSVRRALTMAIDRQGLIDGLLYGYGRESTGHIPPLLEWAYEADITPAPHNPSFAKRLLANNGWVDRDGNGWVDKNGVDFVLKLQTDATNSIKSDMAVVIQEQLRQVGVKVEIELKERSALYEGLFAGEFEAYLGGWNTSIYVDPYPLFHSQSEIYNFGGYSNPNIDQLIEKGAQELDWEKAGITWKEFQREFYEDHHYTFICWLDRIVAVNGRFENVNPIPLSALYEVEKWYDRENSDSYSSRDHE